jgi:hypothetical protein
MYAVRRCPKRRYAAHTCTYNTLYLTLELFV